MLELPADLDAQGPLTMPRSHTRTRALERRRQLDVARRRLARVNRRRRRRGQPPLPAPTTPTTTRTER